MPSEGTAAAQEPEPLACGCDWITKYCDEHHYEIRQRATRQKIEREVREALAAEVRALRGKGDWGFWTAAYQDGIDRAVRLIKEQDQSE